jgi:fatty acid synthase subunit alpha
MALDALKGHQTDMRNGNIRRHKFATSNARGEKAVEGPAEVSQHTPAHVFTVEAFQQPMDIYSSPGARAAWEGTNTHLLPIHCFPIIGIHLSPFCQT